MKLIEATFYDGRKATYPMRLMYGPLGLMTDPAVFEIMDLQTGEILYEQFPDEA